MELKNYEFNAHGVELGQFYDPARLGDGTAPAPGRDADLYYVMSTVPARTCRTPGSATRQRKLALMDFAPYTRWTLITGIAGEAWAGAADKLAHELRHSAGRPS